MTEAEKKHEEIVRQRLMAKIESEKPINYKEKIQNLNRSL